MRISARGLALLAALALPAFGAETSLEQFVDGVVEQAIVNRETVGATVAVVQNGRLLLAKGYGKSDKLRGLPVVGRETQFRIGSISKVLVWMSVLQQVEAGKLDLDTDVNEYLTTFKLDRTFPEPITLRHLMTHTPGFEDTLVNLFAKGPRGVGELKSVLAQRPPLRVRLPGTLASYSNYGAALAALVVANVTQTTFEAYVEQNIFAPLGMTSATLRQPVPEAVDRTRAKGYSAEQDTFIEKGFTYVPMGPAGAGTATGLDLARLMVELLNPQGTAVLSARSKALLLGGAYVVNPLVNGMTLGMFELTEGGARAVGHGGNILWFQSRMVLWPDERFGLFVSVNTSNGQTVVDTVAKTVAERLGFRKREVAWVDFPTNAQEYAGNYLNARRAHSDFTKLLGLAGASRVGIDRDAEVLVMASGQRFKMIAEDVFQRVDGFERLAFTRSGGGIDGYTMSNAPMLTFQRAQAHETVEFNALVLGAWLVLFLGAVLVWPISSFARRKERHTAGQRLASGLALLSGLLMVFFFSRVAAVAGMSSADFLVDGVNAIPALLWMPAAYVALVAVQLIYLYRAWSAGFWWPTRRLHYSLLYFAQVGLAWAVWYWNLMPAPVLSYVKF